MDRRTFIQLTAGIAAGSQLSASCNSKRVIPGSIVGSSHQKGHLLRDKKWEQPTRFIEKEIVIVGAGISGLSAARHLLKNNKTDFLVFDLESSAGGNARSGHNEVSAYPWGAHYVPIPNNSLTEYLDFLKECEVITSFSPEGLPVYNELFLCFDPQERLYVNGKWQEGLVPQFGVPSSDMEQLQSFLSKMDEYRHLKTADGKDAFTIPVDNSGRNEALELLDTLTMEKWMKDNDFTSLYLHRYVNYCCRDDFGTPHHKISAWAGIHYFASRKGKAVNAEHDDVLTWPQGNSFFVEQLGKGFEDKFQLNSLVTSVIPGEDDVIITYIDKDNAINAIRAKQCILAVPQFVAARLLHDENKTRLIHQHIQYSPWMVANLKVKKLEERSGVALSWDNVLHESQSLGYVVANHQVLQHSSLCHNLTYYLPLTGKDPVTERQEALKRSHTEWLDIVISDLKVVHPNIESAIEEANIMLWGHAMVQPLPGHIFNSLRTELAAPAANQIHFAHTDLAGISIFEEGFYQGLNAAKKVITLLG